MYLQVNLLLRYVHRYYKSNKYTRQASILPMQDMRSRTRGLIFLESDVKYLMTMNGGSEAMVSTTWILKFYPP